MYQGLQSSKRDNQLKTWILIVLLPAFLGAGVFVVFYFLNTKNGNTGTQALNLALDTSCANISCLASDFILFPKKFDVFFFWSQRGNEKGGT